jgi:predicted DNA binding CopG/RHH family protein
MLHAMEQPGANASPPTSPNFAGLLAALAARARDSSPAWNDDGLEDDGLTLSYERALRAQARLRPAGPIDQSFTDAVDPGPIRLEELPPADDAGGARPAVLPDAPWQAAASPKPQSNRPLAAAFERNLKNASITIRMSSAECAQLHRRATEAGLTISAYLRSCTFEAESLRAMVKETLAQLRLATAPAKLADAAPPRQSRLRRLARILIP